jgi:hypothetical protein
MKKGHFGPDLQMLFRRYQHGNRHGDIITIQAAIQGNEMEP